MKDSESIGRSNKKANGKTGTKLFTNGSPNSTKSNGTTTASRLDNKKQIKTTKAVMGSSGSTSNRSSGQRADSTPSSNKSGSSGRKGNKQSPELRPRRRASQTYFFKYQLAKNPLKQEEEDLRLALLASLQQCGTEELETVDISGGSKSCSTTSNKPVAQDKKAKQTSNKNSIHLNEGEPRKRPVGRPPKNIGSTSILENGTKKRNRTSSPPMKKKRSFDLSASSKDGKRRDSVESNSSKGSSLKEEISKKKKKHDRHRGSLLAGCNSVDNNNSNSNKPRSKVKNSLMGCNDLASVQDKIKRAKKLLQNKQANKNRSDGIISKYSALRKFPSNSAASITKSKGRSLLSPTKIGNRSPNKSKTNNYYQGDDFHASANSNHSTQSYYMSYSPYTPLQKKEPPDEDYLKKYKPETEDFLTFICFRTTAPNYQNYELPSIGVDDSSNCTSTSKQNNNNNNDITNNNNRTPEKQVPDPQSLKQFSTSSNQRFKLANFNGGNSSGYSDPLMLVNFRRPVRQSPRLANSNRKISENDSSNHSLGNSNTAYDTSITYEEDMKRASIALEDMAQEINSSDDIHNEVAQNQPDYISKTSSPYKDNKHIVKGLMTREFAGAFADEETIFESISNHKL